MKSLKNVQIIAKVMKILAMIAFVSTIVACCLCVLSIPIVVIFGNNPQILKHFVDAGVNFNKYETLCYCICGAVSTGFMIALYACVVRFYNHELQVGTPFDDEITKKSRLIGWLHIILALAASIIVAIISTCFKVEFSNGFADSNIVVGAIYLIISYVFAYGCDLKKQLPAKSNESIVAKNESNSATVEQATEKTQPDKNITTKSNLSKTDDTTTKE